MNKLIIKLFTENWNGEEVTKNIDTMKKQLFKNLDDQLNGYWSGSTAYYIMTKGGFLIDSKRGTKKELTVLGKLFIELYRKECK